jgi:hypothetical protein
MGLAKARRSGAYGLAFDGLDEAAPWLVAAPGDWPALRVGFGAPDEGGAGFFAADEARIALANGKAVELTRHPLTAVFESTVPRAHVSFIHPYLTAVAAVASTWLERESFHGGGIELGGGVWGVFGARGGGKSSLLAQLAAAGVCVFSDDLLVTDGKRAFAGPRSVDLRADAATALGAGESVGVVGQRERWRVRLGDVAPELPLRGCIHLEWGDRVELRPLPAAERLARLASHAALDVVLGSFSTRLLELASLPAVSLRRPPHWDHADESITRLVDTIAA